MFVLLDKGIPWDVISDLSSDEVYTILGVEAAIKQKQSDDQDAVSRAATAKSNVRSFP
tara:strand:- start:110 stop:283 length:174 start_codon:yes stop_codon:yes gene_type:complete